MVRYFIYKFVWWIKKEPFVDVVDIFDVVAVVDVVVSNHRWLVLCSTLYSCWTLFQSVFGPAQFQSCNTMCVSLFIKKYKTIIKHFDSRQRIKTWKLNGNCSSWPLLKFGWIKGYEIEPKIWYACHCIANKYKNHKHCWYKKILIHWLLPKWIFLFIGSTKALGKNEIKAGK